MSLLSSAGIEASIVGPATSADRAPCFGRAGALADLDDAVRSAHVVTATGPPGVGKTHLVAHWATARAPACVVDLAAARTAYDVYGRIAAALDVAGGPPGELIGRIGAAVRARGLRALVLDTCEHVLPAVRELATRLPVRAPGAALVMTSRQPLRVRDERVLLVAPLGAPRGSGAPLEAPAVRLLLHAAGRAGADPHALAAEPATLLEIARLVDGLPLALELAAAQLTSVSPRGLCERLRDRLAVLSRGPGHAPARHASLAAAIAWSWDLLSRSEQRVLAECSVFGDGFTLAAAEAVVTPPAGPLIDVLHALHERSLLTTRRGDCDRFAMLQAIREFAAVRLDAIDLCGAARRRYLAQLTAHGSADVRIALGLVERGRDVYRSVAAPAAVAAGLLRLHRDGVWFQVDGEPAVACDRWKLLQRLLVTLARARLASPGTPVSARDLVAAGWPEETILPGAARNRLHVALHRLRRLGLGDLLRNEPRGWLVSPQVDLALCDGPCPASVAPARAGRATGRS